jgi:hypothetical protein
VGCKRDVPLRPLEEVVNRVRLDVERALTLSLSELNTPSRTPAQASRISARVRRLRDEGVRIEPISQSQEHLLFAQAAVSGKIKLPDAPQKRACAAKAASNMVIHATPSTFVGTSSPNHAGRTDIASATCEAEKRATEPRHHRNEAELRIVAGQAAITRSCAASSRASAAASFSASASR